jgi:hypothetical protein
MSKASSQLHLQNEQEQMDYTIPVFLAFVEQPVQEALPGKVSKGRHWLLGGK